MLAIIINPKSGGRTYRRQRLYLFRLLKSRQEEFVYRVTRYASHATEIAKELVESGYRTFLVLGGDGTLSEVIDGVMHADISDRSAISIGLMPRGTGNDWGRYWGLNHKYKRSLDIFFNHSRHQPIDIGCLSLRRAGVEEKHYFINSVGFGIDAETCKRADRLKRYVGSHSINYFFALLSALFSHRSRSVVITTDDGQCLSQPMLTMNIGNGPFSGGGIRQNPQADPTDGHFDAMFVSRLTGSRVFQALPKLFNGRLSEVDFIHNFRAKDIMLQCDGYTVFEKDGIVIDACGPYRISIIPRAIKMVVPFFGN